MIKYTSHLNQEKDIITRFIKDKTNKNFLPLYENYSDSLMRTAIYLSKYNKETAEDIFQDTWITAIKNIDGFKSQSSLKTWLTGILFNKYKECLRKQRITESIGAQEILRKKNEKTDILIDTKNAIRQLPEGCSRVLILYDIEGFKHKEIAEILNISIGTSKSQLSLARKKMRILLSAYHS